MMARDDLARSSYSPGEIEQIERAAERRGREAAAAGDRTIEPMAGELAGPVIPNELSQVSHAGLALSVGDLLQRVASLEAKMATLVEPDRPTHIEHEPTPQGPVEDAQVVSEPAPDLGDICRCGHLRGEHTQDGRCGSCSSSPPPGARDRETCKGFRLALGAVREGRS